MRDESKYVKFFTPWLVGKPDNSDETRAYCPLHEDPDSSNSPSASLNFEDGVWHCQSCSDGGQITDLYKQVKKQSNVVDIKSGKRVKAATTKPLPSMSQIREWCDALITSSERLRFMEQKRGLTVDTIAEHLIGWDRYRYTIPIFDENGDLVNVRRYKPNAKKASGKMISWGEGYGEARIYGLDTLEANEEVLLAEGELDRLIALQHKLPAVTHTGGAAVFKREWAPLFEGKHVYVAYDDDPNGDKGASKVAQMLKGSAAGVYRVKLETGIKSGDITDHFVTNGDDADSLWLAIENATVLYQPESEHEVAKSGLKVTIEESQSVEYTEPVELIVDVAGKATPAYIAPRKLIGTCGQQAGAVCNFCPLSNNNGEREVVINPDDARLANLIDASIPKKLLADILEAKCTKFLNVEVAEEYNIEDIVGAPSVEHRTEDVESTMTRRILNVGTYSTKVNQPARIVGKQIADPRSQRGLLLTWVAEPVKTDIETFQMTPALYDKLKKFQCGKGQDPMEKCRQIAVDLAANVTHIYGRDLMHIAYDLIYHSAISFYFSDEFVDKGWLDALVIGDTRTGKSKAANKLRDHYRAGNIASCESATLPGLLAGVKQMANSRWMVTWGALPRNDKRLLFLDELSGLWDQVNGHRRSKGILENLSSVRSEGIAEVSKIESGKTSARVRLAMISNPINDRRLADMPGSGIAAITDLIQQPEDIARFDFAIAVPEDVPSDVINTPKHKRVRHQYTSDLCHQLVMWAWSRKSDQIRWMDDAEETVYKAAQYMGDRYVSDPPLIQAANVRMKIARIAVAFAARTFSTSKNGELILVRKKHVVAAVHFLDEAYKSKAMGYLDHSSRVHRDRVQATEGMEDVARYLRDNDNIATALRAVGSSTFRPRDFEEMAGLDKLEANQLVTDWVSRKMIRRGASGRLSMEPALVQILEELNDG